MSSTKKKLGWSFGIMKAIVMWFLEPSLQNDFSAMDPELSPDILHIWFDFNGLSYIFKLFKNTNLKNLHIQMEIQPTGCLQCAKTSSLTDYPYNKYKLYIWT